MKNNMNHENYMYRCIEIAKKGQGTTYPNPCVGCIIVYKDKIISEAHSSKYGGDHAEVNAINKVENKKLLKESSLYVTLEPCCHQGKTPPCTSIISKYKIPNVIIGAIDQSDKVNGKGVEKLIKNKINVITDVLGEQCRNLHKNFLCFHKNKRPYIILKWAESKDKFIGDPNNFNTDNKWISSKKSRQLVHKWRSMENSILVGYNTVIHDNPNLNVRHWKGINPIRIVIDLNDDLSKDFNIFNSDSKTIKITKNDININNPLAQEITKILYSKNIQSVIVEGGKKTLECFININLWDEARIFTSNKILGKGLNSPKIVGKISSNYSIDDDKLSIIIPT